MFANNKGADQHAHSGSLTTFINRLLESIIYKPATSEISIFQLVSVAEGTGLRLALSETSRSNYVLSVISEISDNISESFFLKGSAVA